MMVLFFYDFNHLNIKQISFRNIVHHTFGNTARKKSYPNQKTAVINSQNFVDFVM